MEMATKCIRTHIIPTEPNRIAPKKNRAEQGKTKRLSRLKRLLLLCWIYTKESTHLGQNRGRRKKTLEYLTWIYKHTKTVVSTMRDENVFCINKFERIIYFSVVILSVYAPCAYKCADSKSIHTAEVFANVLLMIVAVSVAAFLLGYVLPLMFLAFLACHRI